MTTTPKMYLKNRYSCRERERKKEADGLCLDNKKRMTSALFRATSSPRTMKHSWRHKEDEWKDEVLCNMRV